MPFVITDLCRGVKDGACVEVCPVSCIHPEPGTPEFETASQLYIEPESCIDCGLCAVECPVSAIFRDDELPEDKQQFAEINADWFR